MKPRRAPGWTTASPRRRSPCARTLPALGTWVLLAALVLRALIPAGYMLDPRGGAAPFMVCTSIHDGVSRILETPVAARASAQVTPQDGHVGGHQHHGAPSPAAPSPADDSHEAVGPCAFAALAALILPPPVILGDRRPVLVHRWRRVRRRHLPRQRAPGDPGARAPPRAA